MYCRAAAAAATADWWWKTLGVSLGVCRLDLFTLCCHYLALLLAGDVCAVRNMNFRYCAWHSLAAGQNVSCISQLCKHTFSRGFLDTCAEFFFNHFELLTFRAQTERKSLKKTQNTWDVFMHCVQKLCEYDVTLANNYLLGMLFDLSLINNYKTGKNRGTLMKIQSNFGCKEFEDI